MSEIAIHARYFCEAVAEIQTNIICRQTTLLALDMYFSSRQCGFDLV